MLSMIIVIVMFPVAAAPSTRVGVALLTAPPVHAVREAGSVAVELCADPDVPPEQPYASVVLLAGEAAAVARGLDALGAADGALTLTYDAANGWIGAGARAAYLIFNSFDPDRFAEFTAWYDDHVAHAMEHMGFTGAQRFVAPPDTVQPYPHLVVYGVPEGGATRCEERRLAVARDRDAALAAGRTPAVPVTTAIVPPRLAGFYRVCTAP
jgi:hypothetical protein